MSEMTLEGWKARPDLADADLRALAKSVVMGDVFTSNHVTEREPGHLLTMIFMPIGFMDAALVKELVQCGEMHMAYANISDAMPRGINGYPMFMRCGFLRKGEYARFMSFYDEIKAVVDAL